MAFDTNLTMLTAAINGSAVQTGSIIDFGGDDLEPITYNCNLPETSGSPATWKFEIQGSNTNSTGTMKTFATVSNTAGSAGASIGGTYFVTARTTYRYRRAVFTPDSTTGSSLAATTTGCIVVNPDLAGRYTNF